MIQFIVNSGGHSSAESDNVLICMTASLISLCTEKGLFTEAEFERVFSRVQATADQKLAARRDEMEKEHDHHPAAEKAPED